MLTNRKVIETNIKSLENSIRNKKESSKTLKEDCRLLNKYKEELAILDAVGEDLYTKMYPYR